MIATFAMSLFVLMLLSAFIIPHSLAQTFRLPSNSSCKCEGTVNDIKTGEPLSAVTVAIVGTTIGAFTNDSGRFCIVKVPSGMYRLRVTYVGYVPELRDSILFTDSTTTHL